MKSSILDFSSYYKGYNSRAGKRKIELLVLGFLLFYLGPLLTGAAINSTQSQINKFNDSNIVTEVTVYNKSGGIKYQTTSPGKISDRSNVAGLMILTISVFIISIFSGFIFLFNYYFSNFFYNDRNYLYVENKCNFCDKSDLKQFNDFNFSTPFQNNAILRCKKCKRNHKINNIYQFSITLLFIYHLFFLIFYNSDVVTSYNNISEKTGITFFHSLNEFQMYLLAVILYFAFLSLGNIASKLLGTLPISNFSSNMILKPESESEVNDSPQKDVGVDKDVAPKSVVTAARWLVVLGILVWLIYTIIK